MCVWPVIFLIVLSTGIEFNSEVVASITSVCVQIPSDMVVSASIIGYTSFSPRVLFPS